MAWQDRDYNQRSHRSRGGGGSGGGSGADFLQGLVALFNWSLPIGTYLAIRVRVHIIFLVFVLFQCLGAGRAGLPWTLRWTGLLFVSVLLHEFGHCLACRRVGGVADEILMWPLGGLAMCQPPRTIWAEFWTVAWGPLVSLLLAAGSYGALAALQHTAAPVSLNPFDLWAVAAHGNMLIALVRDLFLVNYTLLLFNLVMVFYPFDGGRLVQIGLWRWLGYVRSMLIATRIGMVGAVAVGLYAILTGQGLLIGIALFGFLTCLQQHQLLKQGWEPAAAYEPAYHVRARRRGLLARWRQRRLQKRQQRQERAAAELEAQVDRVLAKVKEHGLHSLTVAEKKALQRATELQRRAG